MPRPSMPSICSRTGTENSQFGWLQFATVSPQPHWQVSPSAICCTLTVGAATTTIGIANAHALATITKAAVRIRSFRRRFTRQAPPGTISASSSSGDGARTAAAITARSRTFGHITITVPSAMIRPPAQSQKTSGVRNTWKVTRPL